MYYEEFWIQWIHANMWLFSDRNPCILNGACSCPNTLILFRCLSHLNPGPKPSFNHIRCDFIQCLPFCFVCCLLHSIMIRRWNPRLCFVLVFVLIAFSLFGRLHFFAFNIIFWNDAQRFHFNAWLRRCIYVLFHFQRYIDGCWIFLFTQFVDTQIVFSIIFLILCLSMELNFTSVRLVCVPSLWIQNLLVRQCE